MRRSSEVLSDTEMAALLGDDTFTNVERGLERLWDAIWTHDTSEATSNTR
jgi:hypothetical protein